MHSRIGRSRGFGGTHIQRFRAGQRVNIPRSIWGSGRPMVRNTTIYLGGYSGGNHCCCGGGGSKFLNWMTGITAFMGVFSGFFGSFFGSRQTPAEDPNTSYTAGYQAGLGTLTGNASAAQGADSSSRTQAQKELDSMNKNKKYTYTNGQIPSVTDDGKYKYGNQTYDTISDLEAVIEKDQQPADTVTNDDEAVKKDEGQGGPDPTATPDDMPIEESANAKTFEDVFKQGETKIKVSSEVARDYDADVKLPENPEYTTDGYPKSIRVKLPSSPYGENAYMNLTYDEESKTYKQKSGREFKMAIDANGNISLTQTNKTKSGRTAKTDTPDSLKTVLEMVGLASYYNPNSKTFYGISL